MSQTPAARTKICRTPRPTAVGLVVVTAAIIGILIYQSASSSVHSFSEVPRGDHGGTSTEADGAVTEADGALPDGVTVFDHQYPGVANLDPDLLQALS
jgi:D-alanyl-D-alanine carboxypeptidase